MFHQQNSYGQMLAELSSLYGAIRLTLPASTVSVRQQLQRILSAQHRLYQLEATVIRRCVLRRDRSPMHQRWSLLLQIIQHSIRYADSLRHLAEEFPIDPEGTVACLRHLHRRQHPWAQRLQRLHTLSQASSHSRPVFALPSWASLPH